MGYSRTRDARGASGDDFDDFATDADVAAYRIKARRPTRRTTIGKGERRDEHERRRNKRPRDQRKTFRCRRCKTLVGPPVSGGRYRNHCPLCLYSLHVDGRVPGDRASECRSLMEPVGVVPRRSGEQAILHRCLGCGFERHCRVAADDNPLAVMRLPLVTLSEGERRAEPEEQETA